MVAKSYKPRKKTRERMEADVLARATIDDCEHAASLAYAQAENALSNTSKAMFDLLAALANEQARLLRTAAPEPVEISLGVTAPEARRSVGDDDSH